MPSSLPSTALHASILFTLLAGCAASGPTPPPAIPTPASGPVLARVAPAPPPDSAPAILPAALPATPEAPAPTKTRRAALRFDLEGQVFPSPLVDAVVGGEPTTLIVDTGATHHVVAQWLAGELSIPTKKAGDAATDHAGRAVAVSRLENAGLSLSGWGQVAAPVLLVIGVPDVLQRLGVGGFLSPQELAADGRAVILDLRVGSMTEAPIDEALGRLGQGPGGAAPLSLHPCAGGPNEGSQIVATVSIDGIPAEVKIDSGASHSSLFGGRGAGQKLAGHATGTSSAYAASGKLTVPTVPGAKVNLGAFEATADVDILPKSPAGACPSDGYLGMDVLRDCVIVLAKDRSAMRCAAR